MSDGKVIIETGLDNTGIERGLTKMGSLVKNGVGAAAKLSVAAIAGVTAAIGAASGAAISFGIDYKQASNQLQAETGATKEEMIGLSDAMKEVYADNFGESLDDVAQSMAEVKRQIGEMGGGTEGIKIMTEDAIALRDTFGYDVAESVRSANTMMTIFGIDGEQAFDLIAQGAQRGLDYSDELIDSINEYSVQFNKVGLDAEDMFNIFESGMKNGAWNLDKIGDAVKEMSIRVIDGSDTTADGFKRIGLNAAEMSKKFAAGGDSAKEAFYQVIKGLRECKDPLSQNTAGVDLFGTMWEDLGPEVVTQLDSIKDGYDQAKDTMGEINAVKYDDLASALEGIKRHVQTDLLSPISDSLMPAISDATNAGIGYIQSLSAAYKDGGVTGLIDEAGNIFSEIAVKAAEKAPQMVDTAVDFIEAFTSGLRDNGPKLTAAGVQLVKTLADGFVRLLPSEIQRPVQDTIDTLTKSLTSGGLDRGIKTIGTALSNTGKVISKTASVVLPPLSKAVDFLGDNLDIVIPLIAAVAAGMKAWSIFKTAQAMITGTTKAVAACSAAESAQALATAASTGAITLKQIAVGLLTGKIGLATAAQWAWNTAMNANPIGLIVTAIGALTAGLAVYAATQDTTNHKISETVQETKDLIQANQDYRKELENNAEQAEQRASDIYVEAAAQQALADRLFDLSDKAEKTNSDKAEMSRLVDELNTKIPGLGLVLDGETGALNRQRDEVNKLIESTKDLATAKAYSESAIEAKENAIKLEGELKKLYDEQLKIMEEMSSKYNDVEEARKRVGEAQKNGLAPSKEDRDLINAYWELEKSLHNIQTEINNTEDEMNQYNSNFDEYIGKASEYQSKVDDISRSISEQIDAINMHADSIKTSSGKIDADTAKMIESMLMSYDKLDTGTKDKFDKMLETLGLKLNERNEIVYSSGELAGQRITEGIDAGAKAGTNSLEGVATAVFGTTSGSISNCDWEGIGQSAGNTLVANVGEGMAGQLWYVDQQGKLVTATMDSTLRNADLSSMGSGYGAQASTGLASGITSGQRDVHTATATITSGLSSAFDSQSLPSRTWGSDLISGLAQGIRGAKNLVSSAVSTVANIISSWLHFSRPEKGPLHYYEQWMPDFMRGLAKGIAGSKGLVVDEIGVLAGELRDNMADIDSRIPVGIDTSGIPADVLAQVRALGEQGAAELTARARAAVQLEMGRISAVAETYMTQRINSYVDTRSITDAIREGLQGARVEADGRQIGEIVFGNWDRMVRIHGGR